jgi:hypothetical protein
LYFVFNISPEKASLLHLISDWVYRERYNIEKASK